MKCLCGWMLAVVLILSGCSVQMPETDPSATEDALKVNQGANALDERFSVPEGYERVATADHSFEKYLQTLPLKPYGEKVKYYDGRIKRREVYEAVIDLDVGERDLQQCADAVIRLRAEYLFEEKRYDDIHFNFTNGFNAEYSKWRAGYRIKVEGNSVNWVRSAGLSTGYKDFRKYLDMVFAYAGSLSLSKELRFVDLADMQIGDVFMQGGSPGHCVIVVDMAENTETGEKVFMLAQSYMPAQDIHILKNPDNQAISPWYSLDFGDALNTPEWNFQAGDLKRF